MDTISDGMRLCLVDHYGHGSDRTICWCSDEFVSAAVSGTPSFNGVKYAVATSTLVGVMPSGTAGVNHGELSLPYPQVNVAHQVYRQGIAIDGNAVLLTVTSH